MSNDRLPVRVDRATFDRVLQRAAEIQASSKDIGDGLSEEEILALGAEVGIPVQHLKQALLEERSRAITRAPETVVDRWVGVAELAADRVVQGTPETILGSLARFLDRHEHFIVQRATLGRTTFEPMHTIAGAMRKVGAMFNGSGTKPFLGDVELVTAVVTPLESGFCHVSLAASMRKTRSYYIGGATALGVVGVLGAGGVAALGAAELIAALPAIGGIGAGWLTSRVYRAIPERAQLGLERILDELERAPALPAGREQVPPTSRFARQVGEAVREITQEVKRALDK